MIGDLVQRTQMEISSNSRALVDLATNRPFIFCTYFLGIGAWAVIAKHDFISSNWKTVRETRQSGQAHVILVGIPMIYVGFYIYVLALKSDFKLGAAVFAFAFAGLHLLRTLVALWQLAIFKSWVISSIESIESLGYRSRSPNGRSFKIRHQNKSPGAQNKLRVDFIADQISINNTIIENKLSSGVGICKVRFLGKHQKELISRQQSGLAQFALCTYYWTVSLIRLPLVGIPLLFPGFWDITSERSTPYLEPYFSEEIFLRWACVLIANSIPEWLQDMKICAPPSSEKDEQQNNEDSRSNFAKQILLSASLHLKRIPPNMHSKAITKSFENFGFNSESSYLQHSSLPYEEWLNYPLLQDGLFSLEEFLKFACTNGKGLPFHAPHRRVISKSKYGESYNYAKFESWLVGANLQLEAELEEIVKDLRTAQIEWLAVFLSVDNWRGACKSSPNISIPKPKRNHGSVTGLMKNGFPVGNLSSQLGFSGVANELLQQFSHPLLKDTENCELWRNRNVMELSLHIDNWLALRAGDKTRYMMDQMGNKKRDFLLDSIDDTERKSSVADMVFERNVQLQIDQSMFQFSLIEPKHHNFEHTMTFLGCSMESLRSSLARWTEQNEKDQLNMWNPRVNYEMQNKVFSFKASSDLRCCIHSMKSRKQLECKYFHMRLLWELQSFFHAQIEGSSSIIPLPARLDAIILCLLSFPSLAIKVSKTNSSFQSDSVSHSCFIQMEEPTKQFDVSSYKLYIQAGCGPQLISVHVSFRETENLFICVEISTGERQEMSFSWEAWKNAFLGRLEGARKWQDSWGMSTTPLLRTKSPINSGIASTIVLSVDERESIKIWKGWLPHRTSLCQYELESEGFIKRRIRVASDREVVTKGDLYLGFNHEKESYVPVHYDNADPTALRRATALAIEALHHSAKDGELSHARRGDGENRFRMRMKEISDDPRVELTLLKISCVAFSNTSDLKKAFEIIIEYDESTEDAVELLERFYTVQEPYSAFFRSNENVETVETLFQEALEKSRYSSTVARPFARFYTVACSNNREEMYEKARNMLFKSMIENIRENDKSSALQCRFALQNLLRTQGPEEMNFSRSYLGTIIDHSEFRRNNVSVGDIRERNEPSTPNWQFVRWMKQNTFPKWRTSENQEPDNTVHDDAEILKRIEDAKYTLMILNEKVQ